MQENDWQMPKWWYQKSRPTSDSAYFENMCRVIFQAGLNWKVVDMKWPSIKEAFCDFNIQDVAAFTAVDVARLLKDSRIIRSKGKIQAIVRNAITFSAIEKQYGSFQKYLDNMDKSENYSQVIKALINNFKWLGAPSASMFLYTVGEDINVWGH